MVASAHLKEEGAGGDPASQPRESPACREVLRCLANTLYVSTGAQEHPGLGEEENFG